MSSQIQTVVANNNYNFLNEGFLNKDNKEGVQDFKAWCRTNINYKLIDGDAQGMNMLMYAMGSGNVSLVSHIIKVSSESIHMRAKNGDTLFGSMTGVIFSLVSKQQRPEIAKIQACTFLVIKAGADVNICCRGYNSLNALVGNIAFIQAYKDHPDPNLQKVEPIMIPYIQALTKIFIAYGALYKTQLLPNGKKCCETTYVKQAEAELATEHRVYWEKILLPIKGQRDEHSVLSKLPQELIQTICFKIQVMTEEHSMAGNISNSFLKQ